MIALGCVRGKLPDEVKKSRPILFWRQMRVLRCRVLWRTRVCAGRWHGSGPQASGPEPKARDRMLLRLQCGKPLLIAHARYLSADLPEGARAGETPDILPGVRCDRSRLRMPQVYPIASQQSFPHFDPQSDFCGENPWEQGLGENFPVRCPPETCLWTPFSTGNVSTLP